MRVINGFPSMGPSVYLSIIFCHGLHWLLSKFMYTCFFRHLHDHDVSCYLHKCVFLIFLILYPHTKLFSRIVCIHIKKSTNRSIPTPTLSLFGLLYAIFKTSSYFSSGNIFITSLMSCMNITPSGKISVYSSSLINVIYLSSFSISTSGVDISDSVSMSLPGSLL